MKFQKLVHVAAAASLLGGVAAAQSNTGVEPETDAVMTEDMDELSDRAREDGMTQPQPQQARSTETFSKEETATLRALDKITGRATDFEIEVGEPVVYGSLRVDLKVCYQAPPEEPPESAAFLQIDSTSAERMQSMAAPRLAKDVDPGDQSADLGLQSPADNGDEEAEDSQLFSGWMFASSPGLSALEHPVYDVWVIRCTEVSPVSPSSPEDPAE